MRVENLNPLHLEDLNSDQQPSCYVVEPDYQLLILRRMDFEEESLKYKSNGYVISGREIFAYDRSNHTLQQLEGGFLGLYQTIDPVHQRMKSIMESYALEVDRLEDGLYDRDIPGHFMDIWFDLKKDLSKIERYYQRSVRVLNDFVKAWTSREDFPELEFKDLIENINFNITAVHSQLTKLDSLHHYYVSIKNDRLNKNIYYLTVLSAVFLPLNLVVGFFGMNTEGLFFKDHPSGTLNVLQILIGTFLVALLGLRFVRFIDRYILKRLFSRYDVYKSLAKKIESLF